MGAILICAAAAAAPLPLSSAAADTAEREIALALETDFALIGGDAVRIWARPFLYKEQTYVPFEAVVKSLSVEYEYDDEQNIVSAQNGWHRYVMGLSSPEAMTFDGVLFVPMRQMCADLGFYVFWDDGLIIVSAEENEYDAEYSREIKYKLCFEGYSDKYYYPRQIVDPRVTYSYDRMLEDISFLEHTYPELISSFSIGKSVEGRDITAFTLGKGEKRAIICASMHAREYIATNFIMYMADLYALGYVNNEIVDGRGVRDALDSVTLVIIPMVNPDGINLAQNGYDSVKNAEYVSSLPANVYGSKGWKANVNGVDLNNNFDVLWSPKGSGPAYAGYGGPAAASEPETLAMQNYIMETDFEVFASLHTQGQVVYWMDPNCDQALYGKFKPYVDRLCREIGFNEMPSTGAKGSSGYMADYVRYYKKKMAMTIELCPYLGEYPYPESDFDKIAAPVLSLGLILADICLDLAAEE